TWRVDAAPMAIAATGGSLFDRIRRIVGAPADEQPRASGWAVTLALIALCTAGAGAVTMLQPSRTGAAEPAAAAQPDISDRLAASLRHVHDHLVWIVRDTVRWMTGATAAAPPTPPTSPT